jgi:hypothetical protein
MFMSVVPSSSYRRILGAHFFVYIMYNTSSCFILYRFYNNRLTVRIKWIS